MDGQAHGCDEKGVFFPFGLAFIFYEESQFVGDSPVAGHALFNKGAKVRLAAFSLSEINQFCNDK